MCNIFKFIRYKNRQQQIQQKTFKFMQLVRLCYELNSLRCRWLLNGFVVMIIRAIMFWFNVKWNPSFKFANCPYQMTIIAEIVIIIMCNIVIFHKKIMLLLWLLLKIIYFILFLGSCWWEFKTQFFFEDATKSMSSNQMTLIQIQWGAGKVRCKTSWID